MIWSAASLKVFSGSFDTINQEKPLANLMLSMGWFSFFNSPT